VAHNSHLRLTASSEFHVLNVILVLSHTWAEGWVDYHLVDAALRSHPPQHVQSPTAGRRWGLRHSRGSSAAKISLLHERYFFEQEPEISLACLLYRTVLQYIKSAGAKQASYCSQHQQLACLTDGWLVFRHHARPRPSSSAAAVQTADAI